MLFWGIFTLSFSTIVVELTTGEWKKLHEQQHTEVQQEIHTEDTETEEVGVRRVILRKCWQCR